MSRYANLNEIRSLDPQKDYERVVYLITSYEFPFDNTRSLEFALFRTFAVPSVSNILDLSQEFYQRPQKRYDDTAITVGELMENGIHSERGRAAIRHMNRLHGRFDITNDDYLYVLSTFVFEPIRWVERFGWRKMCEQEKLALFYFWREIARHMNIKDVPATYEAFEAFNLEYERKHFQYSEKNHRVGKATVNLFLSWFPAPLRPLILPGIYAMMDEPLLKAFGFPAPPGFLRTLASGTLKLRGSILRWLPPRRKPRLYTRLQHRSYSEGYQHIEQLGPPEVG